LKALKVRSPSREELKALFSAVLQQLGGEGAFYLLLRDFYRKMSEDLMIGFFFDGKDLDQIADRQAAFILNAAGLRDRFEGKGPSTAHMGLPPILPGFFDRRLRILEEVLAAHHIPPPMADAWVRFEAGFRSVVVSEEQIKKLNR